MAEVISSLAADTAHVIQLYSSAEITTAQAIDMLLTLALQAKDIRDLDYIRVARETVEEIESKDRRYTDTYYQNRPYCGIPVS